MSGISKLSCVILFFSIVTGTVFSQVDEVKQLADVNSTVIITDNKLLSDGIEYFRKSLYKQAIINFRDILLNPELERIHGDAYFWIAKSYMILGKLDDASKHLEYYLANFPKHSGYAEALYQKGRLLFMQNEYENSIQILSQFVESYPNSVFVPNAYFWIGETLYLLGRIDDSLKFFKLVEQKFPASYKYEAAKYRISLIEFKKRENELLKLLKWSHMEALKSVEEFQKRERTYEQAITSYQKRLTTLSSTNTSISDLTDKIAAKDSEILKLKSDKVVLEKKIETMQTQLDQQKTTTSVAAIKDTLQKRISDSKQTALDLKEALLELLAARLEVK